MKKGFVVLGLLAILWSCGSSQKTVASSMQSEVLEQLVDQKSFQIVSEWAQPMNTNAMNSIASSGLLLPGNSGSNISLIANPNYLKMMGDSVAAYLPYFGERQLSGGYGIANAIEFKGLPDKLEISQNSKKKTYIIGFTIKEKSEVFQVTITLFNSLASHITINSSQRNFIRYIGKVSELPKEEVGLQ
ncbi:MAG: DUF4251 domain-containing protein [Eudoraea sp.]|nr:DUF4251 domain-containing protein [Eudoraea sp.]